jgi:hypothetical protein
MSASAAGGRIPASVVDSWLGVARDGFCAVTGIGAKDSACSSGPCHPELGCKGTFNLPARATSSWPKAARACLRWCRLCGRCNYISVSLKHRDCSWFESCNTEMLHTNVPGFRTAVVMNANSSRVSRHVRRKGLLQELKQYIPRTHRTEVNARFSQLLDYAASAQYNLSQVHAFLHHESLRGRLGHGVHLSHEGRRWEPSAFKENVMSVYVAHNAQTADDRQRLAQKWRKPLLGHVDVWSLLNLLHFTIDHTDAVLHYTSQFIHSLQVFATVLADPMPERDERYRRDMRLAALVHDLGKLLTLFGEADGNVDCMNRVIEPFARGGERGLEGLRVQWNHDEYGWMKLKKHLPPRVADVVRYHSLREVPYIIDPAYVRYAAKHFGRGATSMEERIRVTEEEVTAIRARLDPSDLHRAEFVGHFAYYDRTSKMETSEIPIVDVSDVRTLLSQYFPGGVIEW